MRKLAIALEARLKAFLGQRRNVLLVVDAGEAEYLPLVASAAGIEDGGSPDDFLLFPDPFENPGQYASALVQAVATRYAAIGPALREAGEDVPERLPSALLDERRPPVDRLRDLFVFERGLLADLEASRVVIGLLPSRIADPAGYARLVMSLVAHELPLPWCHHMRFIVREDRAAPLLTRTAQAFPRTEFYRPDFGQEAIAASLEAEAFDESEPLPVRMQALVISAGMDYAHKRLPSAMEKYGLAARYYGALGPPVMVAVALNGTGEVLARAGKPVEAQRQFERALTPAVAEKSVPVMTTIMLNLANLHRDQRRWKEAYGHYEAVSELAKLQVSISLQLRCLEQMGFCQQQMGDPKRAWEHWQAGVELARGTGMKEDLLDCLQRIRFLYKELRMSAREREVVPEVTALEREGVKVYAA